MQDILDIENGTKFIRADLHIHSYGDEGSFDVTDESMTPENIVDLAIEKGLKMISITDHNSIGNVKKALEYAEGKDIFVIPGIEVSTIQGHLLLYFPTFEALSNTVSRLSISGDKETCNQGICECLNFAQENGGIGILAHIELSSGFEKSIGRFGPPIQNIFKDPNLFGLEISRKENFDLYTDNDKVLLANGTICPKSQNRKSLIKLRRASLGYSDTYDLPKLMSSDSHELSKLGTNADGNDRLTRFKVDDLSFKSFKNALINHKSRVKIEDFIPERIPRFIGLCLEGGLLDNQKVHFSNNLTCIIGGRGTGKSTLLESLRECSGNGREIGVLDSDVWPDKIELLYEDETGNIAQLSREKNGDVVNLTDSSGLTKIPIDSYGQGETADTIQHSGEDPSILLDFLDDFLDLKWVTEQDEGLRVKLLDNQSLLNALRLDLNQIPEVKRHIKDLNSKVEQLEKDDVGDLVTYYSALIKGKEFREGLITELNCMVKGYTLLLKDRGKLECILQSGKDDLIIGQANYEKILASVRELSIFIDNVDESLNQKISTSIESIKVELKEWEDQETEIHKGIQEKKEELSKKGIPFDVGNINRITKDLQHYKGKLNELQIKEKQYISNIEIRKELIKERVELKEEVYMERRNLAKKLNENLKNTIEDFTVTIKYLEGCLSEEFEKILINKLNYRTSSIRKAKKIAGIISPITFADMLEKETLRDFLAGIEENGSSYFHEDDIDKIISVFKTNYLYEELQSLPYEDTPKIIVSKNIPGESKPLIKPIDHLSLGQQQSILLAILLHSTSNNPLIIDQPEDNLDSEFVYKTIVANLQVIKEKRQVIIVTHNANIPVLGDAELIIPLKSTHNRSIIQNRGSLDKPETQKLSCDILEGGEVAFNRRKELYGI